MLTRSFLPPTRSKSLLAYTPMFHSRMFVDTLPYRASHFPPLKTALPSPPPPDASHAPQVPAATADRYLDGNPALDRPLFVQFCSNTPADLLAAARLVQPFCDAVDLNLGCPQGIARRGHYGAFLQEDWGLISSMIGTLHAELDVPVTAKMRILETKEKSLAYARMVLEAGASIITVHGRQREQKGHNTGLADWSVLRYLRDNLPPETVIFANGNILQRGDIDDCLEATGADGVMSAEGNLSDPTIFADPVPEGEEGREYWRGRDGKGGFRVDAVMRRYMDIIYTYVLNVAPPARPPLFLPSDPTPGAIPTPIPISVPDPNPSLSNPPGLAGDTPAHPRPESPASAENPAKKQKRSKADNRLQRASNPNLTAMQAHLFRLLRPLVARHHNVRDALARCRVGDIAVFENVLRLVEEAVRGGLMEYENGGGDQEGGVVATRAGAGDECAGAGVEGEGQGEGEGEAEAEADPYTSSLAAVARCKRPWWVCQPYVRPLPNEALEKGSMTLSKKEKARLAKEAEVRAVGLEPDGRAEKVEVVEEGVDGVKDGREVELPREGVVCG